MILHSGEALTSLNLCYTRHFLIRQYRAQLKRRAQRVQEELVSLLHPLLIRYFLHLIEPAWLSHLQRIELSRRPIVRFWQPYWMGSRRTGGWRLNEGNGPSPTLPG